MERKTWGPRGKTTPPWCRSSGCAEVVKHDFEFMFIETRKRQRVNLCVQEFKDDVDPPLVINRDSEVAHGLVNAGAGQLLLGNVDLPANTTQSSSHQSTVIILGNAGKISNTRLGERCK